MLASRGMGAVNPSKMPKGVKKARRDDTDFTQFAEGGSVNEAGNYTKPEYAATTRAKRAGKAAGKQFVKQPPKIAAKTAGCR